MSIVDIYELLAVEAEQLREEVQASDPTGFLERIEARLAVGGRPATDRALRRPGGTLAPARPPGPTRDPRASAPAPGPAECAGAVRAELLATLEQLCAVVMAGALPGQIDAFFAKGSDISGATVTGCLLYSLGSHGTADVMWRVAAGADEPMAAHLLVLHYTTTDQELLADLWRERTSVIGVQNLPELPLTPVADPTVLALQLTDRLEQPTLDSLAEMAPALGTMAAADSEAPWLPEHGGGTALMRAARTVSGPARRRRRVAPCS